MSHVVEWLTAAPLWDLAGADPGRERLRAPALLRFASDGFMDEVRDLLGARPGELGNRVARPETWEQPEVGWAPAGDASLGRSLKLFQPAHQRYYLLTASLVCRRVGLPNRKVDVAKGERAAMVMRRLVPRTGVTFDPEQPASYVEHAWVGDRQGGRWLALADPAQLTAGEERLPLFPLPSRDGDGVSRRVLAGLVPVAGRELYEAAAAGQPVASPPPAPNDPLVPLADPRKATWVSGPATALSELASPSFDVNAEAARDLLRFALLDLADLLVAHLQPLWLAVGSGSPAGLSPAAGAVLSALDTPMPRGGLWRQALVRAEEQRAVLLGQAAPLPGTTPVIPDDLTVTEVRQAAAGLLHGGQFQADFFAALGDPPTTTTLGTGGAPADGAAAAAAGGNDGAFYRLRCVYEQPQCEPFHGPLVSAPSRPFRLAPFFDPDAPARPLTIRMPLDTSIQGLKRFPKGVSMLISNKLRQQVERVQGVKLGDIDDGNIGNESSWTLGMICSFSIPIITICAFIVLMIFISLLNIVFWWLPFLKICLPIPVRSK